MTCADCRHIDTRSPFPGEPHPIPGFGWCSNPRGWVKLSIERPNAVYPCRPERK